MDDVPDSLWQTLHHSKDVANADINRSGYVRDATSDDCDEFNFFSSSNCVPMVSSGVVNVNCSDLSTSEITTNISSRYCSDEVGRKDNQGGVLSNFSPRKSI